MICSSLHDRIDIMKKYLPREKYQTFGVRNLSDAELFAIIFGNGVKGADCIDVAKSVVRAIKVNSVSGKELNVNSLTRLKGIGSVRAMQVGAVLELGNRLFANNEGKRVVTGSKDLYELVRDIANKKQEYFVGVYLNARYELIAKKILAIGSVDKVHVEPRQVIAPALRLNAVAVGLAHNHPSGNCEPSSEDIEMTKKIIDAGEILGVKILDHMVVSKTGWRIVN